MDFVRFWNSLSDRWVWGTFPLPNFQLSATNIKKKPRIFLFPFSLEGSCYFIVGCGLFSFLFIISAVCLGRRGQEAVKLNNGQQPFSFWLGRALLKLIQAQPWYMRAGSSSAGLVLLDHQFPWPGPPCCAPVPALLSGLMKQLDSSAPTLECKGLHLPWLQWPWREGAIFLCPIASLPLLIPWVQVCASALAGWVRILGF